MAGPFRTDVSEAWEQAGFADEIEHGVPLARIAEPEEVVGAALYLASDASSFTTGAVIKVDGVVAYSAG